MNRESTSSIAEVLGVAVVAAASLGGIIVALGRSQSSSHRPDLSRVAIAPEVARHQLEHGKSAMRTAATTVAESYPAWRESAVELLTRVAGASQPQAARASDIVLSRAHSAKATGAQTLERLQETVLPVASDALSTLKERTSEVASRSSSAAPTVRERSGAFAEAAVSKSTSTVKETLALTIWVGIAFSLIYFVVLDEERREKVRSFLFGAMEQARLLAQDFQGYEEEV